MIQDEKWYSARQIAERDIFFWVRAHKTILSYLKHPEFKDILQPKTMGSGTGTRYYVQGKNLKKFVNQFKNNKLKGLKIQTKSRNPKNASEEWRPAVQLINEGRISGVKTYYSLKKKLAEGKLKGIKFKLVNNGNRSFYFVDVNSLPKG